MGATTTTTRTCAPSRISSAAPARWCGSTPSTRASGAPATATCRSTCRCATRCTRSATCASWWMRSIRCSRAGNPVSQSTKIHQGPRKRHFISWPLVYLRGLGVPAIVIDETCWIGQADLALAEPLIPSSLEYLWFLLRRAAKPRAATEKDIRGGRLRCPRAPTTNKYFAEFSAPAVVWYDALQKPTFRARSLLEMPIFTSATPGAARQAFLRVLLLCALLTAVVAAPAPARAAEGSIDPALAAALDQ